MSIKLMSMVWDHYPGGGADLLALLALADWADDDGGNCYPSMTTISRKLRLSERQTKRVVHSLIDGGWIHVVGGHTGGAPGTTRHYQIDLSRLAGTGDACDTGTGDARDTGDIRDTGDTGGREGCHPCPKRGVTHVTQSTNDPPRTIREGARAPKTRSGTRLVDDWTLPPEWATWTREHCRGVDPKTEGERFRDYWIAVPGARGRKADWLATWRNWCRKAMENNSRGATRSPSQSRSNGVAYDDL